ncbi:MAG: hypothetical protein WJ306_09275 [Ferrovum myxofaciens]
MRILISIEYAGKLCWFLAGQPHFDSEPTIPDAPMMGAMVAPIVQMVQEGHQHFFIEAVGIGDSLPVMRLAKVMYPSGRCPMDISSHDTHIGGDFRVVVVF